MIDSEFIPNSITELKKNEELILFDQNNKEIIVFYKKLPPKIVDILLKQQLELQGGVYIPLYLKEEFKNLDFIPLENPHFYQAFKKIFSDLNETNHYRWKIVNIP